MRPHCNSNKYTQFAQASFATRQYRYVKITFWLESDSFLFDVVEVVRYELIEEVTRSIYLF